MREVLSDEVKGWSTEDWIGSQDQRKATPKRDEEMLKESKKQIDFW